MLSHQRVAPFEKDEEAWPSNKNWGWDLRFQKPMTGPVSLFLLLENQDLELSVTVPAHLPACCHVPRDDDNGLNL